MKRAEKQRLGRLAIEQLKQAYKDGRQFEGAAAIRDYCLDVFGIKSSSVNMTMAAAWDRQARYELADARYSVTSPVGSNRYLRDPNAAAKQREASETPRWNDYYTRTKNIRRLAEAAASQSDATMLEMERALRIKIADEVIAPVLARTEVSAAEDILVKAFQN